MAVQDTTVWYGKPGTTELLTTSAKLGSTLEGYVKMQVLTPPDDGKFYVVSDTGDWEYPRDNETIRKQREAEYSKLWPANKQLEALMDLQNGDATKWNQMNHDFAEIKAKLPYVNQPPKLA